MAIGGLLFALALIVLVASGIVVLVRRRQIPLLRDPGAARMAGRMRA